MKLYRTADGAGLETGDLWYDLGDLEFDSLLIRDDLREYLLDEIEGRTANPVPGDRRLLAPIAAQEVWAAGVTYFKSRTARMEEAESAGGGTFYDRVYHAERPELFFKATPHRVVGPEGAVFIRGDSKWNVPEPELTILVSPTGKILGYTIGNDMSSRDIEGENPLYLPQAKVYQNSCAIGPCIYVSEGELGADTSIELEIRRGASEGAAFADRTTLAALKRKPQDLIEYLFRYNTFPNGCFLMTGTGIVPPDTFTLEAGDVVSITIEGIGTLRNIVQRAN